MIMYMQAISKLMSYDAAPMDLIKLVLSNTASVGRLFSDGGDPDVEMVKMISHPNHRVDHIYIQHRNPLGSSLHSYIE
jgi:hypothetical protein